MVTLCRSVCLSVSLGGVRGGVLKMMLILVGSMLCVLCYAFYALGDSTIVRAVAFSMCDGEHVGLRAQRGNQVVSTYQGIIRAF
jgi:hypothetical protein